ncbi:MAG: amidohydrolase family protein [Steroidobacterales bacterium]
MTWVVNGNLIDVVSGRIERRHLQIDNGRITAITASEPARAGADAIDMAGAYLLPGFFDCHVHICVDTHNPNVAEGWTNALPGTVAIYASQAARRMLMAGITTVREVGGWDYHEIAVRDAINAGWIEGPRMHCAGRILTQTSSSTPYWRGMYEEADGPDAVRRAARQQLARGANFIKLLATGAITSSEHESANAIQYRPEEIRAAVEIAEDNHTYVAAHAHAPTGIRNAVNAGCHSIEHTIFGEEPVYRLMAERGTWLVPTVCVSPAMFKDPVFAAAVPAHIQKRYAEIHEVHTANINLARRLGVRIAMGTDAGTPGNHCGDNMQELEVMVLKAGFSSLEAIKAATTGAAAMMRLDRDLGTLEPGKIADIIATAANPLNDISALRAVHFVMKDGRIAKHEH